MLLSALALWLICLAIGVAVLALDHMPAVPALFGGGMFMLQFEWAVVTSSLERRRLAVSSDAASPLAAATPAGRNGERAYLGDLALRDRSLSGILFRSRRLHHVPMWKTLPNRKTLPEIS
jgi:hypothetical protein